MKSTEIILLVVVIGAVGAAIYFATRKAPVVTQPSAPKPSAPTVGSLVDKAIPLITGLF